MLELSTIRVPFYLPIRSLIERVRIAFQKSKVVQVKGFPVRVFCLRDAQSLSQMYADPQASMTKSPVIMPRVQWLMGKGRFALSGGDEWRENRPQTQGAFRRTLFHPYLQAVTSTIDRELDSWAALARGRQSVDVYEPVRRMFVRLNVKMFVSRDLTEQEVTEIDEETHFIESNFVRPSPLQIPFPRNRKFVRLGLRLRARVMGWIAERRAAPDEHHDLLAHMMRVRDPNTGLPLNDSTIVDEFLSVYFGAAVMSSTIAWAMYRLGTEPKIQESLFDEVRRTDAGNESGNRDEDASLTLLPQVVKEVIRLYPAAWGYPRRTDHLLDLNGVSVPGGSIVIPLVYLIHRNPEVWTEPDRFFPGRFDKSEGSLPPFTYLPFSAGPRACLGAALGPMVLHTVLAKIVQKYRLEFESRFAGDPLIDFAFGIQPKDQVRVILSSRN